MISDNLRNIMQLKDISLNQLAEEADIPLETLRNIYYGKVKDTKLSTILKLSKSLNVSVDWLAGNDQLTKKEREIITNYRTCGVHGKNLIELVAKFESTAAFRERTKEGKHVIPKMVPIGHVTDGILYNSCNTLEMETSVDIAYLGIEVTTNNFAPAYCKDDVILLENRFPEEGERAVFFDGLKAYFRLYEREGKKYRLKCLNGRGQDMLLSRMDEVECIGTCIGVVRS